VFGFFCAVEPEPIVPRSNADRQAEASHLVGKRHQRRVRCTCGSLIASLQEHEMNRSLTAVALMVGLLGTVALAQPPQSARPPLDPLAEAKARQQIADQKATFEVEAALKEAERLARSNAARAIQTLRSAQTNIDLAVSISGETRKNLTALLQGRIAQLEGRPLPQTSTKTDPAGATVKFDRRAAYEAYSAEIKAVNEAIQTIARFKQAGLNAEAERELAALTKAYPNNPAVIRLQDQDAFGNRVQESIEFNQLMNKRVLLALRDVDRSALPATGDIEFPKDWKEKTARRLKTVELTAREKKIIEALDKPISVNWNGKMLEEALQELSTVMDQNLFLDKKSIADLGIDLQRPVTLEANAISTRTVLRQLLAAQGLTFVVKDESIQIVTVEKARDMLVTRVYYLGDIVQGVGPFGGAPQWGTFLDFQQTMANVETIIQTITKSIDPLCWRQNGGPCTITFHYPSMSIIVRASAEVHATLGAKVGGGR
jgi:hypothetical protein